MVNCSNCGRENADHFNFCLDCGTELTKGPAAAAPPPAPSSPVVAPLAPAPVTSPSVPISSLPPPPSVFTAPPPVAPSPASPFGSPLTPLSAAAATLSAPPSTNSGFGAVRTEVGAGGTARPSAAQHTPTAASFTPGPLPPVSTTMGQVCPTCQAPVPAGMRFCGSCGTRLDPSAPPPPGGAAASKTQFMHVADVAALVQPKARLILIDQQGKEGTNFTLKPGDTPCGRVNGAILFIDDMFVSPTHCTFRFNNNKLNVKDNASLNGVYFRLRAEIELQHGDLIRMGRQLMRFESESSIPAETIARGADDDSRLWGTPDPKPFGRVVQVMEDGRLGEVRLLRGTEVKLGREVGDIVFPQDGFVSGQHCVFSQRAGRVFLRDVGSSNGTYVRIRGERDLGQDDFLLVGNQLLRVDMR
ncbi:MAG: FHA domain-containing protein [Myxococcota bacterium]